MEDSQPVTSSPVSKKTQCKLSLSKREKMLIMGAYEKGFNAGIDAINADSKNEYAYMQRYRRKYMVEQFDF